MKNFLTASLKAMPLLALVLTVTFSSCKKGDTGPAGPQGAAGNANVKNSTIFINANEWVYKPGRCEVTKLVPDITADLLNKGAIVVYSEGDAAGSWEALPTSSANSSGVVLTLGYSVEVGKLNLYVTFNNGSTLPAGTLSSGNFKLVLIAGSARKAHPNVNLQNHEEVTASSIGAN